ncbi:MAG TPA: DNA methyltransferase [Gemmataceae bacterium]|nr:DNA methyltransferase [Gemmataceae bacterium]
MEATNANQPDGAEKGRPVAKPRRGNGQEANKLLPEDRAAHEWYRFVQSFPPHLVRQCLERFGAGSHHQVLDPFCGTGTTLVECKKLGIPSVGVEANPMAHFASEVKVDWLLDADKLLAHARHVAEVAEAKLEAQGIEDQPFGPLFSKARNASGGGHNGRSLRTLPAHLQKLLLTDSISPLPLHKTLVLLDCLEEHRDDRYYRHERLALAKAIVYAISNLHFGPEVGVAPAKSDAPVVAPWLSEVEAMASDLPKLRAGGTTPSVVHRADARRISQILERNSIDAVITSPPYPNEKDYTRTTRLESVLLGFLHKKDDIRALKRNLVRSNTRGVYKGDDDDRLVAGHAEIERIAQAIEKRRIEMGKTSGFERMYHRVTRLYFGGMARHLSALRSVLRPGAQLAYVVGDQASYLRVMIRTGELLGDLAESLGYELVGIDLFRTRLATATKEQLREEVVLLRWPGA